MDREEYKSEKRQIGFARSLAIRIIRPFLDVDEPHLGARKTFQQMVKKAGIGIAHF
jgi:hypothetical protein